MSAYGIAGLVDGFFKGREIKHGWQDRKDNKARQAKLDEFYAAEQGRVAERHSWARGDQGRKVSDYERARADEDATRSAYEDAITATEESLAGGEPAGVTTSTMGAVPPGPTNEAAARLPGAIDSATRRAAAAEQFERYFDPNDLGAAPPPVTEGAPAGPRRADVPMTDTRGESIAENRASTQPVDPQAELSAVIRENAILRQQVAQTQTAPAPAAAPLQDTRRMDIEESRAGRGEGPAPWEQPAQWLNEPAPAPAQPAADPMAGFDREQMSRDMADRLARDQPNYEYDFGSGGLPGDAREVANRAKAGVAALPAVGANLVTGFGNTLRGAVNPVLKYATGGDDGITLPMQQPLGAAPRPAATAAAALPAPAPTTAPAATAPAAAAPAAATGPRVSNVPPGTPAPARQLAAVADQAMGEASTPAIQAAAAAVAKDEPDLGAAGNRPFTEKQRERASTAFMERYMEVGAPMVIKEYLRRGQVDKAIAFQEFLEGAETKAGMRNWARASFAASVGDFDSFATEIMEGYNRLDYFGDDTTIVTDQSGFTDPEGNITKDNRNIAGAKIVFRDENTGKTFEQVYENPEDIVTMGVTLLAPEEAFEYWSKKTEAAREAALGAAKSAQESEAATAKEIREMTDAIVEGSKDISGVPTITRAEARRQAKAEIEAGTGDMAEGDPLATEGAAPPGPPVLRRP